MNVDQQPIDPIILTELVPGTVIERAISVSGVPQTPSEAWTFEVPFAKLGETASTTLTITVDPANAGAVPQPVIGPADAPFSIDIDAGTWVPSSTGGYYRYVVTITVL